LLKCLEGDITIFYMVTSAHLSYSK